MADAKVFYRKATADFPLSVYYFAPTFIAERAQPLQRSESFAVLLMQAGALELHTPAGIQLLGAGDICIVPPYTLRAYHTVSLNTQYTLLAFRPELFPFSSSHFFYRKFLHPLESGSLSLPRFLQPGQVPYAQVLEQMQRLDIKKEGTDEYTMELLSVALNICTALYPYSRQGTEEEEASQSRQSACEKCLNYIRRHFREKITLQDLAEHVHLHPNYLCAMFHEQTGKTVFEQLNWVRVHEASKLLRGTDLPISQIAAQCGFQNPNFFARKFKATLGRSPTAYRKIAREEAKHKKPQVNG